MPTVTSENKQEFDKKKLLNEKNNEITLYRAGGKRGLEHEKGGATFYSTDKKGALPYAEGKEENIKEHKLNLNNVFDTKNIEHHRIYRKFLQEGKHPYGTGKTNRPFWTSERDLRKHLLEKGIKHDAIVFDENTGHPSYAVYHKD